MTHTAARREGDEMICATCGLRWDVADPEPPRCQTASEPLVKLIGLSGAAGSGKSTAAQYLHDAHRYQRKRFAQPLKDAMRRILQGAMLDDHTIERMIEGDLKEVPTPVLLGKTPRHAMQTLGTEWGRHCIGEDFWVNLMRHALDTSKRGALIVIEDVRFDNEAALIRSFGGRIIRMEGRGGIAGSHVSEAGVEPDLTCYNGGSLIETHRWFDYVLGFTTR
jgi:hypothetical protein